MNPHYPFVAGRAGHRCEYCHAPEATFNCPFEVEHIVPPRRGGHGGAANLALACRTCNVRKSDHLDALDPLTGKRVRLFNPRADAWDDHFSADPEAGTILGTTATGRATVERLAMNSASQLAARRQWMRLELFP